MKEGLKEMWMKTRMKKIYIDVEMRESIDGMRERDAEKND